MAILNLLELPAQDEERQRPKLVEMISLNVVKKYGHIKLYLENENRFYVT